jgi:hypothetical protein
MFQALYATSETLRDYLQTSIDADPFFGASTKRWRARSMHVRLQTLAEMVERAPQIVAEIGRYIRTHPYAADTLEGVTRWWLPSELAQSALTTEVEAALAELTERRLVERHKVPGGWLYVVTSK